MNATATQGANMPADNITARLQQMLAENAGAAVPEDAEMIAGDLGLQVTAPRHPGWDGVRERRDHREAQRAAQARPTPAEEARRREAREAAHRQELTNEGLASAVEDGHGIDAGAMQRSSEWCAANAHLCTGRGPTGRLRNFRAMNDAKLRVTLTSVRAEGNDPEALQAVQAEARTRGW